MSADIVRRAEFKRARKYRARIRKRNPPERCFKIVLRDCYSNMRALFPTVTPLLAQLQRRPNDGTTIRWGGTEGYNLNV